MDDHHVWNFCGMMRFEAVNRRTDPHPASFFSEMTFQWEFSHLNSNLDILAKWF